LAPGGLATAELVEVPVGDDGRAVSACDEKGKYQGRSISRRAMSSPLTILLDVVSGMWYVLLLNRVSTPSPVKCWHPSNIT
jgi:hypothetical protein